MHESCEGRYHGEAVIASAKCFGVGLSEQDLIDHEWTNNVIKKYSIRMD